MSGKTYMLSDDRGEPLGVVSLDAINTRANRLAFTLAAVSNKPRELERLTEEAIAELGSREFGYVAAGALGIVVQDILEPLVQIAEEVGVPMRERLTDDAGELLRAVKGL
ncbi:hypothetical protein [Modestobacter lapidis]|nr:hypothetical protein [Modestobacter lapidis]